jgi:hypothetical protein
LGFCFLPSPLPNDLPPHNPFEFYEETRLTSSVLLAWFSNKMKLFPI